MLDLNDSIQYSDLSSEELQPLENTDIMDSSIIDEPFLSIDEDPLPDMPNFESWSTPEPPDGPIGTNNLGGWDCTVGCAGNCAGSCNWMCQNSAHNDPI